MKLRKALKILKLHEAELRRMGITSLTIFGSTARGESRDDSDVDLFFEHEGSMGLFRYMEIKERTSEILSCKADIMAREGIRDHARATAEADAVRVF